MGRVAFFLWVLGIVAVTSVVSVALGARNGAGFWIVQVIAGVLYLALITLRLRDLRWSPWWAAVLALPTVAFLPQGEPNPWLAFLLALPACFILGACFLVPGVKAGHQDS